MSCDDTNATYALQPNVQFGLRVSLQVLVGCLCLATQ